jgi:tetratricopeptide (TPR) repeat protein
MGFRMRKSFKVMPGVRMTVTPRGVSTSVGSKYGRVSAHSSGRVTTNASVPGTGVSYVSSSSGGRRSPSPSARGSAAQPVPAPAPPKPAAPGLLAPKWEKELFKALVAQNVGALAGIAQNHPESRHICMAVDAFMYQGPDKDERGRPILEELWRSGFDPEQDRFMQKYVASATTSISVAPGISASLPLSRQAIGLALAELRQESGDLAGATDLVESLEPSTLAAVSLAELYGAQARWQDVVDLTNGLEGNDDFTIFLLTQRGIALREQGYFEASREAFKSSLSRRSQPAELRHCTLIERAATYQAEGKRAMARKDLERVLAEDATYPGLRQALDSL